MKKNISYGRVGFVFENLFWAALAWLWYRNIFFRCLPSLTYQESMYVLWGLIALSCTIGILLEMKEQRNGASVFFNLVLAYGTYTVLIYFPLRRVFMTVCLLTAGILSLFYVILVMGRQIKDKNRKKRILRRRAVRATLASQRLMGLGLALIMAVFGGNFLLGSTIIKSENGLVSQTNSEEYSLANNLETVALLQEDAWRELTTQERLNVLQTVANIEKRYLGLPNELQVGTANLREGVLGYYSDKTHEIVISMDCLLYGEPFELLDTVCHEAYHSYQYRLVEVLNEADEANKNLRVFRGAKAYAQELTNYVSGGEDFGTYYQQDCESDAREYAEEAMSEYFRRIKEYLEGTGE